MLKVTPKKTELQSWPKGNFMDILDSFLLLSCEKAGPKSLEVLRYHLSAGGSRTRAKIAFKMSRALNISEEQSLFTAACVESLHNASLIHDDLQDQETMRRGQQSVWKHFDKHIALSIGDLMISSSYFIASHLQTPTQSDIFKAIHQSLSVTVHGQNEDLEKVNQEKLSLEKYLQIAENKSAPLFSLACELGFIYKKQFEQAKSAQKAAANFAIAYQLLDDYCDRGSDKLTGEKNAFNLLEQSCPSAQEKLHSMIMNYLLKSKKFSENLPLQCYKVLLDYIEQLEMQTQKAFNGKQKTT